MTVVSAANDQGGGFAGAIWWSMGASGDGKPEFAMRSDRQSSQVQCSSLRRIDDGRWHHLVGIRRGRSQLELWIDGKLERTIHNTALGSVDLLQRDRYGHQSNSTPIYLGHSPAYKGTFLSGSIDELHIYRRALKQGEIAKLLTIRSGQ